ncbi:MAG: hypothetical protein ACQCN6_11185, partial [Candidatus Bathyarchaeia archaeon]
MVVVVYKGSSATTTKEKSLISHTLDRPLANQKRERRFRGKFQRRVVLWGLEWFEGGEGRACKNYCAPNLSTQP